MLVFVEGGKPENPEKNSRSRDENQQQTQPTCDAGSGNRIWATLVATHSEFRLQNHLRRSEYDHMTPLLDELNWLPGSKMLKFRDAVMAYKCANDLAPEYLCAKFKKRSSVHNRKTRNNEKFEISSFRSATGQRTFAYRAVSLWNVLDEDLRNATTVKAFKKALKLVMNE